MSEITISKLRELSSNLKNIEITQHGLFRLNERGITINDVIVAIHNGNIIEQYPDDYPFPSCLILGLSLSNLFIHAVCGIGNEKLWLITAYFPTLDKWDERYKTRKVVQ